MYISRKISALKTREIATNLSNKKKQTKIWWEGLWSNPLILIIGRFYKSQQGFICTNLDDNNGIAAVGLSKVSYQNDYDDCYVLRHIQHISEKFTTHSAPFPNEILKWCLHVRNSATQTDSHHAVVITSFDVAIDSSLCAGSTSKISTCRIDSMVRNANQKLQCKERAQKLEKKKHNRAHPLEWMVPDRPSFQRQIFNLHSTKPISDSVESMVASVMLL